MKVQSPQPRPLPLGQAPLKSLRDLEYRLGIKRDALRSLAENWREHYRPFEQTKQPKPHTRKPKAAKPRNIDNPSRDLKRVQAAILVKLLEPVTLPHFLFGAVRKRSVRMHAEEHVGAKTVVKMDIKSYYPNVTNDHIFHVWRNVLLCSPRLARLLTQLTTYERHLPQGAPTSPALANLLLASIYGPILEACAEEKIVVTAWVDDLIFSGERARDVMELVRKTLADHGFSLSPKKRQVLGTRSVKVITGVRVGEKRVRACRVTIADVRAGINNLRCGRFTSKGRIADLNRLRGQIAYINSLCPDDAAALSAAFGRLQAPRRPSTRRRAVKSAIVTTALN